MFAPRLVQEANKPDQARGTLEQVLPQGVKGRAHITFAEFAERALGCHDHVLASMKILAKSIEDTPAFENSAPR